MKRHKKIKTDYMLLFSVLTLFIATLITFFSVSLKSLPIQNLNISLYITLILYFAIILGYLTAKIIIQQNKK